MCYHLLNIAEGEPWSDVGWTKVAYKAKETKVATGERTVNNCNHDDEQSNAMKVDHCNCDDKGDRTCTSDRKRRGQKQRFSWEIEPID